MIELDRRVLEWMSKLPRNKVTFEFPFQVRSFALTDVHMLPYISYNLTLELHDHTTTQLFASVSCLLCVQSLLFIAPYIHSFLKLSTFWPCLTTENLCPPLTPVELLCRDFGAYSTRSWLSWYVGLTSASLRSKTSIHVRGQQPHHM